jgi:hypothetical protein
MNWTLFILCTFAVIGATFTLGLLAMVALSIFEMDKK